MKTLHLAAMILLYSIFSDLTNAIYISYDELKELKGPCEIDTCTEREISRDTLNIYDCICNAFCSQSRTCCVDSPYVYTTAAKQRPVCRTVNKGNEGYFLIDQCPTRDNSENALKSLCEYEWNGEDDATLLIPVTSLLTHMTYKNYFCYRCHEYSDEFLFWNILLISDQREHIPNSDIVLSYSNTSGTWMIPDQAGNFLFPVSIRFEEPQDIWHLSRQCVQDLISECPANWTDEEVRNKCDAYMSITYIVRDGITFKYSNPHCALCNFENLSNMVCKEDLPSFHVSLDVPLFSFMYLMDINRSDGEKVGKTKKCENNYVWDPTSKKCRSLSCALPGYILVGGKCKPS